MARIVVASTPVHGHVTPLLAVAADLVRRGHEVAVLTGRRFADPARAAGAHFVALPPVADYDETRMREEFPGRGELPPGPEQLVFDLKHIFGDPVPAQYAALRDLLTGFAATAVISDSLFLGALPLTLTEELESRPMTVALGISPPPLPRDFDPVAFDEAQQHMEKAFVMAGAVLPSFVLDALVRVPDHYLQLTVPGFEYPWPDAPTSFRFAGPLVPDAAVPPEMPGWWPELSDGRPVVVVTQGTFANADLRDLLVPALRALSDSNALVVAVTGREDGPDAVRALLGTVPDNVRTAGYVPFELLLPHAHVLVTNGGYGGVQTALRHGVPLVVAGATEDKPKVAARVHWSGTGIDLRTGTPDETALRTAVHAVLDAPVYRARARQLALEFSEFDAREAIAGLVEGRA